LPIHRPESQDGPEEEENQDPNPSLLLQSLNFPLLIGEPALKLGQPSIHFWIGARWQDNQQPEGRNNPHTEQDTINTHKAHKRPS
jgi:hypothetical protein